MYGDLPAVSGRSVPTIAALELPEAPASRGVGDAPIKASHQKRCDPTRANCVPVGRDSSTHPRIFR
jgi:hypothetical protein